MILDKLGGLPHSKRHADDTGQGAARAHPHRRATGQEAVVNVAPSVFRVGASPEISPERTGSDRGTDALSVYPERDSNPHGREGHKILSRASGRSEPRQIASARGKIEEGHGDERAEMRPNGDRHSPDMSPDILTRIHSRVHLSPSGCWLWQGAANDAGYGFIRVGGRLYGTHRVMARLAYGPPARGLMVCHTCDVRRCCNPAHLYYGTQKQNIADAIERGRFRSLGAFRRETTHCPYGHAYDEANTYRRRTGGRGCRACMARRSREQNARRRANGGVAA